MLLTSLLSLNAYAVDISTFSHVKVVPSSNSSVSKAQHVKLLPGNKIFPDLTIDDDRKLQSASIKLLEKEIKKLTMRELKDDFKGRQVYVKDSLQNMTSFISESIMKGNYYDAHLQIIKLKSFSDKILEGKTKSKIDNLLDKEIDSLKMSAVPLKTKVQLVVPPTKQFHQGTAPEKVKCSTDLVLSFKKSTNEPICIQPHHVDKLVVRGFIKSMR